jgi:hypothetical protein
MRAQAFTFLFIAMMILATSPSSAHHSVSAEFDANQRIALSGIITKVTWSNPHAFFFVDVKDSKSGEVLNWMCELGSPNMLATLGWTSSTLKVGMNVSFTGTRARDGSRKVIARNIVADGNRIIAWPSENLTR